MSKGKFLAAVTVWLVLLGTGVAIWKWAFAPRHKAAEAERAAQQQQEERRQEAERLSRGASNSRYQRQINFHLDSFSGYALIRSPQLKSDLETSLVRLQLHDDGADYAQRIQALKKGDADMAAFTVDALIKASTELGELPATIVGVIDETVGADAIVAYKEAIPNIDALNQPSARFVLTPNSPSETLARVVISRFSLSQLSAEPFIIASDAADVVARYKAAKPADLQVYVLWEPYVSQILENKAMHVLADSSRFPSTIVDVIVANDDFALKNPELIQAFLQAYLRTAYLFRERDDKVDLLAADAALTGTPLTAEQAERLVDGIWWKNTQENLAHMGVLPGTSLPHIEDILLNVTQTLLSTGAIARDPTDGHPNYLYYDRAMVDLQDFHPGASPETIRSVELPALTDDQWEKLTPVGIARVPPLVFARGTAELTPHSLTLLDDLAERLKATRYYVIIKGHAAQRGDAQLNAELAKRRASAARDYLAAKGIDARRIRSSGAPQSGQAVVTFTLGQPAY